MWFIRALIILVGVIAVLWVGMQNAGERVDFHFFTREYLDLNLNLLMLVVFVTGMVFSFLIAMVNEMHLRREVGRYRRQLSRAQREMSDLRNLPLDEAEPAEHEPDV